MAKYQNHTSVELQDWKRSLTPFWTNHCWCECFVQDFHLTFRLGLSSSWFATWLYCSFVSWSWCWLLSLLLLPFDLWPWMLLELDHIDAGDAFLLGICYCDTRDAVFYKVRITLTIGRFGLLFPLSIGHSPWSSVLHCPTVFSKPKLSIMHA